MILRYKNLQSRSLPNKMTAPQSNLWRIQRPAQSRKPVSTEFEKKIKKYSDGAQKTPNKNGKKLKPKGRVYLQLDLQLGRLGGSTTHSHSEGFWMIYMYHYISSLRQLEYHF